MAHKSYRLNHCMIAAVAGLMPYALCLMPCASDAAVRRPNRADAYNQLNSMAAGAQFSDRYYENLNDGNADGLPVRVANDNMANVIAHGGTYDDVGVSNLEACRNIYPNGEFEWRTPDVGRTRGGTARCVAVVEMRSVDPVSGGIEKNPVLARAYLAAGDSIKCNISEFPSSSYTAEAGMITFPADNAPTHEDVVRVMNEEQKQNAGLKIAAMAVVGAVGGNAVGKNEVGQDGLFGTGKSKMQASAIGALTGAAIGAGNVYGGKVAGDMILSAGVNAAAGAVVGNMVATGDDVLKIEKCKLEDGSESSCLWGRVVTKKAVNLSDKSASDYKSAFYDFKTQKSVLCDGNPVDGQYKNCIEVDLISIELEAYPNQTIDKIEETKWEKVQNDVNLRYHMEKSTTGGRNSIAAGDGGDSQWLKISAAGTADRQMPAMVVGVQDKTFGWKRSDWGKLKSNYKDSDLRMRRTDGSAQKLSGEYSIRDFYPMYVNASDGGIIDFSNKARLKGTLIGAGAGGAIGAFVAYQGAQDEIENRWANAVTEYKDSLQKVYCVTGQRFLSHYNDVVAIPTGN